MSDQRPIAEPQPAASVVLVRDGSTGLEVLMMERAKTMKFAPGAFVFPGGKIDASDADPEIWGNLANLPADKTDSAYRIGALRELYEEAAVLITSGERVLDAEGAEIIDVLSNASAQLNVADMVPFAHWVTPEAMPRRFDTHFYIVAHNGQEAVQDGNEAISLRWVNPSTILKDWDSDKVPLMFPTRLNLMKLARADSVAEALQQARDATVVRTLPVIGQDDNGIKLTIDPACGFDVTQASNKELQVESGK